MAFWDEFGNSLCQRGTLFYSSIFGSKFEQTSICRGNCRYALRRLGTFFHIIKHLSPVLCSLSTKRDEVDRIRQVCSPPLVVQVYSSQKRKRWRPMIASSKGMPKRMPRMYTCNQNIELIRGMFHSARNTISMIHIRQASIRSRIWSLR